MQATRNQNLLFTSAEVRGGDHDRDSRAKGKAGKDAGSVNSSAIHVTEDTASRSLAAAGCGGGAPEWTSADAEGTCTGSSEEAEGSCSVTMGEAHEVVAKLE